MGRTRILTRPSDGWPRDTVTFARRQIEFALGRFAGRVRSLDIRLTDLNGPKGGVDKQCVIAVRLERRPEEIIVRDRDASAPVAIGRAAERVSRAVARAVHASGRRREVFDVG